MNSAPPIRRTWLPLLNVLLLVIVDLAIVNLSFLLAYWLRFYRQLGVGIGALSSVPVPPLGNYIKALIIVNYTSLMMFHISGLYRLNRQRTSIDVFYYILRAVSFNALIVLSLAYFFREFTYRETFSFSRAFTVWFWALNISLMFSWRWLHGRLVSALKARGLMRRDLIIIGGNDMTRVLLDRIRINPRLGLNVIGYIDNSPQSGMNVDIPLLGTRSQIPQIFAERRFHEAVIVEQGLGHYELLELVSFCELHGVHITMIPTVYDLIIDYAEIYEIQGIPVVSLQEKPVSELSLAIKRVFDVVLSSISLLVIWPLLLAVAAAVRLDSPGSVLFRQRRVGQDGKEFNILKFRTMVADAEARLPELLANQPSVEPVFKLARDPRTTRVGRCLRKSSIDELPQLWNVLRGDMSFVGPRPEEVQFVKQYDIWQRRRLKVKPGITGLQQIKCRGTNSLAERVRYDIYYVRKRSMVMDLLILLKTIPVVFSGRGAS